MTVLEALDSVDMEDVIDRMNLYATKCLRSGGIKDFNGREPVDFVGEVIMKAIEGTRKWDSARFSFRRFLFVALRSEISNYFKSGKANHTSSVPIDLTERASLQEIELARQEASELLKQEGADNEELIVFEYWMDGIDKPGEIASDLGTDVKEIYNITKRIERRLPLIQAKLK